MEYPRAVACILISLVIGLELVKSETKDPISVIILTYSRSGSSFAGELFSSDPTSSYVFEPLYYPALRLGNATPEAYKDVLTKLLTCNTAMLDKVREDPDMVLIRKYVNIDDHFLEPKYNSQQVTDLCKASTNRVMKTIRLRLADAVQVGATAGVPKLKILHLVRDPRARYNSMMDKTGYWNPIERNLDTMCSRMEQDLSMAESLPPSQYKLVKYEDLVTDPKTVATDIYDSIFGMPQLPEEAMRYIKEHAQVGQPRTIGYYSTIRDSKFVPGHWEHDLNQSTIEMVQNNPHCNYVITKLNYPIKKFK